MNNHLPLKSSIPVDKLASVFNNTAATYKFYWFISILQILTKQKSQTIPIKDILIKMICNAWYPVHYFQLSFGYNDKLFDNIIELQRILDIPKDISLSLLFTKLQKSKTPRVHKLILHFKQLVPYRFLSPWYGANKKEVIYKSMTFQQKPLYRFQEENIEINPEWEDYLKTNHKILLDYSYWNLTLFLQKRNPNIPDIANKIIKPAHRSSLLKQRKFWNIVFDELETIKCIYTGKHLTKYDFDLDHFIPWSFVSHDQLWNLIPVNGNINSSKSNKLPRLDIYFEPFVNIQYQAFQIFSEICSKSKMLEDYLFLGSDIPNIKNTSYKIFKERYYKTLSPLIQIANNSGFETWKINYETKESISSFDSD